MQANTEVEVEITNIAPTGGTYITPVWVGFHDGSFDSYNSGLSAQPGLEALAEDGNFAPLSGDFLAGLTYIDNSGAPSSATVVSGQPGSERVDGAIANGAPIAPGETASATFDIDAAGANQYLSYASMILPTNDYFLANGDPMAHDLSSLDGAPIGTEITFFIGQSVNDAGTEVNDFDTSAGNPLFPQLNLPSGQGAPNTGADENGVVAAVAGDPFAGFANAPAGFGSDPDADLVDFNDGSLYPSGLASVTVRVVPEPASLMLLGLGGVVLLRKRRSA